MKDVQSQSDNRGIEIRKVGISNYEVPFVLRDKRAGNQCTVGVWKISVMLKKDTRGTHMSRFAEVLQRHRMLPVTLERLQQEVKTEIKRVLGAKKANLEVAFTYFIWKETPVSNLDCDLPVRCKFIVSDFHEPILEVTTPVTTLCPCSKEISDAGAHNQRSYITIQVQSKKWLWIEDVVSIAEMAASCQIWPILKRPDEKFVTEVAYKTPKFVEDVVRDVALSIRKIAASSEITWYKVICINQESIHVHDAYAEHEEKITLKPWEKAASVPGQTKLGGQQDDLQKV